MGIVNKAKSVSLAAVPVMPTIQVGVAVLVDTLNRARFAFLISCGPYEFGGESLAMFLAALNAL